MSAHDVLESYKRTLDEIAKLESQQAVVRQLPKISENLRRLVQQTQQTHPTYILWTQIYQQASISVGEQARQSTTHIADMLKTPDAILQGTAEGGMQVQSQITEITSLWKQVTAELAPQLSKYQEQWRQDIANLQAIAEIPDLLPTSEKREFQELIRRLEGHLQLDLTEKSNKEIAKYADQWQTVVAQFKQMQQRFSFESIAEIHHLLPETIKVLKNLVTGKAISLADLSPETLGELQRFQHLCEAIVLKFSSRS